MKKHYYFLFAVLFLLNIPTRSQVGWVKQESGTDENLNGLFYINPMTTIVVGAHGTILHSPDNGISWQAVSSPLDVDFHSINFSLPDTGLAVGDNGSVAFTKSIDNYFNPQIFPVKTKLKDVYFINTSDSRIGWAVGDSGVILRTTDDGLHWSKQESGTKINLNKVFFYNKNVGIVLGDSGLILRTVSGGQSSITSFDVSPRRIDFGEVIKGKSTTATFRIQNTGPDTLIISSIISDNINFTISPYSSIIMPSSNEDFYVTFLSNNLGNYSSNITITINDTINTHVYAMAKVVSPISSGWFWVNPIPEGNFLYDVQYVGNDTYIAVGDVGTIIKSTDRGVSWLGKSYCGDIPENFNSLFFFDPFNGFVVGTHGSILQTSDGGNNWTLVNSLTKNNLRTISFFDRLNGFAAGWSLNDWDFYGSIHKTSDGGNTWQTVYSSNSIGVNKILCIDSATVIAVGGNFDEYFDATSILYTSDGGSSWITNILYNSVLEDIAMFDQSTLIAVGYNGNILRSSDKGVSWQLVSTNNYTNYNRVISFNKNEGIILGNNNTVLKTSDSGLTWYPISSSSDNNFIAASFIDMNDGIAISKSKLFRTTDGGITWSNCIFSYTNQDLKSISSSSENDAIAVGDKAVVLRTSDGGVSWSRLLSGTLYELLGISFRSVCMIDKYTSFIAGEKGTILNTTDNGENWNSLTSGTVNNLNCIDFVTPNIGYVVGDNGTVLKTTDGGAHWHSQNTVTKKLNGVSFISPDKGVAVGNDGIILRTINGGVNWIPQTISDAALFSVWLHSDTGVAVGEYGSVFITTNGGSSWFKNDVGITDYHVNFNSVNFSDQKNGTIVGSDGIVLRTSDGGFNWIEQRSGTNLSLYCVNFINNDYGMIVGSSGTILRTTNGGETDVKNYPYDMVDVPNEFALSQNYPNPFNPTTKIHFQVPKTGLVTLKVYDVLGREVTTLLNEVKQPGTYEIEWNASALASGIYFYQLQSGSFTDVKKMILIR